MNQAALPVIQSKDERAKIFAASFRIGVAPNNALLTLRNFDLQPIARTLFFVIAVALLGDDSFQAALLCRFKQIKPLFGIMIGKMNQTSPALIRSCSNCLRCSSATRRKSKPSR